MKIGYIRVSTADQNIDRQEVLMDSFGAEQLFIDRMSGKNTDRPELKRMMSFVREGDTVIVESISRFARNTRDLLELVEELSHKHVDFISQKEAIDTSTPTGKFMLTVFGAVAELEREYILQRQREGIEIAKKKGRYTGRKPIERLNFNEVVSIWKRGDITAVEAMRKLDLKPSTFYRKVKNMRILLIEPMKTPVVKEIDSGLEAMQKEVGGYIQALFPFSEPVALICNEEGKLLGLPLNRALRDENGGIYDIVAGTFFLCSAPPDEEDFASLTDSEIEHFTKLFQYPELYAEW